MGTLRRFSAAAVMAGMIAGGMALGTARLEAKAKGGGDGQAAICAYLLNVINYPGVSPFIKALAQATYVRLGCGV